ncbi:MAG: fasciclin domain-containing protein [Cyanobacteria bacterium J06592_8]
MNSHILAQSNSEQDSSSSDSSSPINRGLPNTNTPQNLSTPDNIPTPEINVTSSSSDNPFSPTVVRGTPRRTIGSDILRTLRQVNQFETLISILELADLNSELETPGFLVLFAPTEKAFDRLETELYDRLILPENRSQLIEFLKNHLVIGEISQDDLERGEIQMLSGTSIQVELNSNGEVKLNGATAKEGEFIQTQNGLIVPIDRVLVVPNL